jgi:SAM-dependent methyltransferase
MNKTARGDQTPYHGAIPLEVPEPRDRQRRPPIRHRGRRWHRLSALKDADNCASISAMAVAERIEPGYPRSPPRPTRLVADTSTGRPVHPCQKRAVTHMHPAARSAAAAGRNREPILGVLRDVLPRPGLVLEVASGTGEHAVWFSAALPGLTWQPTDRDEEALRSIAAWSAMAALPNLLPPLWLDATAETWPIAQADAVVAINMLHIAPWTATKGLIAGAERVLTHGGLLFLYGPFREGGAHTTASNAAFDADLRTRDPSWGIRDLDEIIALAAQHGLLPPERIAMPANNLSVVFRRV